MNSSKFKVQSSKKKYFLAFVLCFLFFNCVGCASLKEKVKGFMGVSTKILEENRAEAVKKTFAYDYFTCFTKTLDILKKSGSYVYAKDIKKHMIAVYVSREDTTPVGIFFEELDKSSTDVQISSPSKFAKELIAARIISGLGK